ncbi:MAG: putative transporter [Rikenellaceae bacterium]|uniref:putative transporter n=1 Tax=Alistipes sp. TaxID=1872444 RepID=UPI004055F357|nr:putative transporter [Rikenellaceae bacterium]
MEFLNQFIFGEGIAHSIFVLSIVIAIGTLLGRVKIFGISLGATWILFVGIVASHFGMTLHIDTLNFMRDFGLTLFVFSIGLQIGPSFFSSLRQGGLKQMWLSMLTMLLAAVVAYLLFLATDTPLQTMVGVMDGAVANTPAMGATQQTYFDLTGIDDKSIPLSFAVSYPIGTVAVIFVFMALRPLLRIDIKHEREEANNRLGGNKFAAKFSIEVTNRQMDGKSVSAIRQIIARPFVISRISHGDNKARIADFSSIVHCGDKLFVVCGTEDKEAILAFLGHEIEMLEEEWGKFDGELVSRPIVVTKSNINGKRFVDLRLRTKYGINITRVNRAGVDIIPHQGMELQLGDKVMVVGSEEAINEVEKLLGNSLKKLHEPHIFTLFLGIALGVLVGSIPFIEAPQPIKLGLAAGPMLMAIIIGRFGTHWHLITYTTLSANLMLREVGLAMFLATIGLASGSGFVKAVLDGGYIWLLYALIIAVVPLFIVGIYARLRYKMNFFTIMGMLSGSTTNSIALNYANSLAGSDMPAISYATVYPLAMFLRVVIAQAMILMFL